MLSLMCETHTQKGITSTETFPIGELEHRGLEAHLELRSTIRPIRTDNKSWNTFDSMVSHIQKQASRPGCLADPLLMSAVLEERTGGQVIQ